MVPDGRGSANIEGVERSVHQPGAELARLQRAGPAAGQRAGDPAARAGQVLRHHDDQPRRVLPGSRRRPQGPGRRRHRGADGRRDDRHAAAGGDQRTHGGQLVARQDESTSTSSCRRSPTPGIAIVSWSDLDAERSEAPRSRSTSSASSPCSRRSPSIPSHPFPYISNLALSIAAMVADPQARIAGSPASRCRRCSPASWRSTRRASCRSRTSSSPSSTRCSPGWSSRRRRRSASPATPTSRRGGGGRRPAGGRGDGAAPAALQPGRAPRGVRDA